MNPSFINVWVGGGGTGIWPMPTPNYLGRPKAYSRQETMKKLVKQVQGEPTSESAKRKKHNEEIENKSSSDADK